MKRCPITYEPISDGRYSKTGLHKLNPALNELKPLPFDQKEQIQEAQRRMTKMSIAGVQPKLSAQLSIKDSTFKIVDKHGSFILKPPLPNYDQVPENEDLTMRMAKSVGIEVPLHGLMYAKDDSMLYFIKRFDRKGRSGKIHVEDFAQVAGMSRDTKYNYSLEKVVALIDEYCTFPMVEKMKLFKRTLFSWLTGNEDMHLKNFSFIYRDQKIELSPAYDLLNTTIVLSTPVEEMALPLKGKKSNFTWSIFFQYFGKERLGLNEKVLSNIDEQIKEGLPEWERLIEISFLSDDRKEAYLEILKKRFEALG
ncbi:MAG TPA: HipA domain-containing protein [Gracilimonas sp.]|uniref:HipA domain-containing protein n=1 Tax=Gracilimonas sp. TaxID=1974203 RepID=UPI002D9294C4|nr:HipA domain-containing protein [Gracilimonas sp.]